jgi:hypothetical protein
MPILVNNSLHFTYVSYYENSYFYQRCDLKCWLIKAEYFFWVFNDLKWWLSSFNHFRFKCTFVLKTEDLIVSIVKKLKNKKQLANFRLRRVRLGWILGILYILRTQKPTIWLEELFLPSFHYWNILTPLFAKRFKG